MRLFFTKMRLEHKSIRGLFYLPLLFLLVIMPINVLFNFLSSWGGGVGFYNSLQFIEMFVPIMSVIWSSFFLERYFLDSSGEWMKLYSKKISIPLMIAYNFCLYYLFAGIVFLVMGKLYAWPPALLGEYYKCVVQGLFLTAVMYCVSFLFRSNLLGFVASTGYYLVFMFVNYYQRVTGSIFYFGAVYIEEPTVRRGVRLTLWGALGFILLGLVLNWLYVRKKGKTHMPLP